MKTDRRARHLAMVVLSLGWSWSAAANADCRDGAPFVLALEGEHMTLESHDACLREIMDELARQSPVQATLPASLAGMPVAASFRDLPIGQGLGRILEGTNYILRTRNETDSPAGGSGPAPESVEIWVLSKKGPVTAPIGSVPPDGRDGLSSEETVALQGDDEAIDLFALAQQARSAPEPEVRGVAIQLFVQAGDKTEAAEIVLAGLQDPDPEVRGASLSAVTELGSEAAIAFEPIAQMALYDESAELRMLALHRLVAGSFPRQAAARAVSGAIDDEDQDVSDLARGLLGLMGP